MGPVVIVHGGAGIWDDARRLLEAVEGCERAAKAGADALATGALGGAVAAVRVLEDDPNFNAGKGATLTSEGTIELDAAVMTGDLRVGAIAACPPVASAIEAALAVHDWGDHCLLAGKAAAEFARSRGVATLGPDDLKVDRVVEAWEMFNEALSDPGSRTGTVGAVALDAERLLAAATSTGGILFKRPGRVGDTPLVGAGTYADDEAGGAASATGQGEAILRSLVCRVAVERISQGAGAQEAAEFAIAYMERRTAGLGGVIVADRNGDVFASKNTAAMPWAACRPGESPVSGR